MIKSRSMREAVYVARMGAKRNAYCIPVVKTEGKRPLARPRRMWVDIIKMDLRWDEMVWTGLSGSGEKPVEGSCEHGNEPPGSIKYWEALE
jgi:hypothetical protein